MRVGIKKRHAKKEKSWIDRNLRKGKVLGERIDLLMKYGVFVSIGIKDREGTIISLKTQKRKSDEKPGLLLEGE